MKTKSLKTILITTMFLISLVLAVKIIKSDYADLRVEYLKNAKGQTQRFINSFIN